MKRPQPPYNTRHFRTSLQQWVSFTQNLNDHNCARGEEEKKVQRKPASMGIRILTSFQARYAVRCGPGWLCVRPWLNQVPEQWRSSAVCVCRSVRTGRPGKIVRSVHGCAGPRYAGVLRQRPRKQCIRCSVVSPCTVWGGFGGSQIRVRRSRL
ncbi:hypothetical protein AVEN_171695-1 [Araneus ventricosus]|uniref:Uncharacterized protein n=1 Tax=Araneus ventricosus TaxID=182803 RepID=A0A4Y2VAP1_ARAVE|nr:hypothetical protein AVEN_171695-1 [Araneus ventricosus]